MSKYSRIRDPLKKLHWCRLSFRFWPVPVLLLLCCSLRAEYASVNIIIALVLNMIWVYFVVSMTGRVERFLGKGGIYIIRKFSGLFC